MDGQLSVKYVSLRLRIETSSTIGSIHRKTYVFKSRISLYFKVAGFYPFSQVSYVFYLGTVSKIQPSYLGGKASGSKSIRPRISLSEISTSLVLTIFPSSGLMAGWLSLEFDWEPTIVSLIPPSPSSRYVPSLGVRSSYWDHALFSPALDAKKLFPAILDPLIIMPVPLVRSVLNSKILGKNRRMNGFRVNTHAQMILTFASTMLLENPHQLIHASDQGVLR